MLPEQIRDHSLTFLESRGFRVASSLPMPDPAQTLRPATEIAARLMALDALFTWVAFPEDIADSERLNGYIERNHLLEWMTEEEREIVSLSRQEAEQQHIDTIGWKLENMWPLAWALGFSPEPAIESAIIEDTVMRTILYDFLPGLDSTIEALLQKSESRSPEEVIILEDRFYCAHNAVRSAQLGSDTVLEDFDPIMHGGVIYERRHSLTWCLSPQEDWDDTDLST
jgi:hypothetical protein